MSGKSLIERIDTPLTATSLTEHLRAWGLAEGQTVLVHMAANSALLPAGRKRLSWRCSPPLAKVAPW